MTLNQRKSQVERTDLSDSRMLEAAIRLIVERGVDKTTLKDVGELAGYSRGLAGYRFGNKAGLFRFVVLSIGEEWLQSLTQATTGKVGFDAIAAAVDAHYLICEEAPDHLAAFYTLWFEAIGPRSNVGAVTGSPFEVREIISGIHDRRRKDVAAWLGEAIELNRLSSKINVEAIAEQFSASIVGIVYQWLIDPSDMSTIKRLHENLKHSMGLWLESD